MTPMTRALAHAFAEAESEAEARNKAAEYARKHARVEFSTIEYELSHGRTPRGRGTWAFSAERNPDVMTDAVLWSPQMTYSEAKRWARDQARERFTFLLYVLP